MSHELDPTSNQGESLERGPALNPRVYVASLADYTAGRLHGVWLDAARTPDELTADIAAMLAASPEPDAEEYAVHDYDDFGDVHIGEQVSIEWVSRVARGIAAHGFAFAAWVGVQDGNEAVFDRFEAAYLGHYDSEQAYAEQLIDDLGYQRLLDESVPVSLRPYARIDTDALARDMQLDGDLYFYPADDGGIWIFDIRT